VARSDAAYLALDHLRGSALSRSCVFCRSGTKLTKEHVYPTWLYRALNVGGPITLMLGDDAVRTTAGLGTTLREVCEACNSGWLNDLEGAFKPLMLDALLGHAREPTILNADGQRIVATWAVKTWLLLERTAIRLRGRAFESADELLGLRRDGAPAASTRVWLGAVRIADNTMSWLSSLPVRGRDDNYECGVVGVFTIGAVVFHIYGPFAPPVGRLARDLGISDAMKDRFVPVWPCQAEAVRWPPPSIFTLDDLRQHWPGGGEIVANPR
jgi:hypothetical protein